jgi:L-iditol 2-dehydrogenase
LNGLYHLNPLIRRNEQGSVAIIGDGPIGLLHLQLVKNMCNANVTVIGRVSQRLNHAKWMGANATITFADAQFNQSLEKTMELTAGVGFNVIIIATSNPVALDFALKIASKNSRINIFAGMPKITNPSMFSLDPNFLHYNQISITGSFSSTPSTLMEAAKLASEGEISLSTLVTHKYHLRDIVQAVLDTETYQGLRVVINRFH